MLSKVNGEISARTFTGITRSSGKSGFGFSKFMAMPHEKFGTIEGTGFLRVTGDDVKKKEDKATDYKQENHVDSLESKILGGEISTSELETGIISEVYGYNPKPVESKSGAHVESQPVFSPSVSNFMQSSSKQTNPVHNFSTYLIQMSYRSSVSELSDTVQNEQSDNQVDMRNHYMRSVSSTITESYVESRELVSDGYKLDVAVYEVMNDSDGNIIKKVDVNVVEQYHGASVDMPDMSFSTRIDFKHDFVPSVESMVSYAVKAELKTSDVWKTSIDQVETIFSQYKQMYNISNISLSEELVKNDYGLQSDLKVNVNHDIQEIEKSSLDLSDRFNVSELRNIEADSRPEIVLKNSFNIESYLKSDVLPEIVSSVLEKVNLRAYDSIKTDIQKLVRHVEQSDIKTNMDLIVETMSQMPSQIESYVSSVYETIVSQIEARPEFGTLKLPEMTGAREYIANRAVVDFVSDFVYNLDVAFENIVERSNVKQDYRIDVSNHSQLDVRSFIDSYVQNFQESLIRNGVDVSSPDIVREIGQAIEQAYEKISEDYIENVQEVIQNIFKVGGSSDATFTEYSLAHGQVDSIADVIESAGYAVRKAVRSGVENVERPQEKYNSERDDMCAVTVESERQDLCAVTVESERDDLCAVSVEYERDDLCAVTINAEREDLCAVSPNTELAREDMCAVTVEYDKDDMCAVKVDQEREDLCATVANTERDFSDRDDMCAVKPLTESVDNAIYRIILDEKYASGVARLVQVYDGDQTVTRKADTGSVLATIDSMLEKTGLVGEYSVTSDGVMLSGIKGLEDVSYLIKITDNDTGKTRYIDGSIQEEKLGLNEKVTIEYYNDKRKQENQNSDVFDIQKGASYFNDVKGWAGGTVEGVKELLQFEVSDGDLSDKTRTIKYSENGQTMGYKVAGNSHLSLVDAKLEEKGLTGVYKVVSFLKDGKQMEKSIYLDDVVDKSGKSVLKKTNATGYLIETVDYKGQRGEALAKDGKTAVSSTDAKAKKGEKLSLVAMVQGKYDRRKTHKEYSEKLAYQAKQGQAKYNAAGQEKATQKDGQKAIYQQKEIKKAA